MKPEPFLLQAFKTLKHSSLWQWLALLALAVAMIGALAYGLFDLELSLIGHQELTLLSISILLVLMLACLLTLLVMAFSTLACTAFAIMLGSNHTSAGQKLTFSGLMQHSRALLGRCLVALGLRALYLLPLWLLAMRLSGYYQNPFIGVLVPVVMAAPFYAAASVLILPCLVDACTNNPPVSLVLRFWRQKRMVIKWLVLETVLYVVPVLCLLLLNIPLEGFRVTPAHILSLGFFGVAIAHPGWAVVLVGVLFWLGAFITLAWVVMGYTLRTRLFLAATADSAGQQV